MGVTGFKKFTYFPELDGMRAVGALIVCAVHSGTPYLSSGHNWIDMFLTLSSFLITALLLQEHNRYHNIDYKHYYLRRVLRIAPPLVVMLVIYGLASTLLLGRAERLSALVDGMYTLSNLSNWIKGLGISEMYYLAHTWSLSLEEQFYLIWPIVLTALIRLSRTRVRLFWLLATLAFLGWTYRAYFTLHGYYPARLYMGLDMRVDNLLLGAMLAVAFTTPSMQPSLFKVRPILLKAAAICTMALVIYCNIYVPFWQKQNFLWVNSMVFIGFTLMFWDVTTRNGGTFKWLFGLKPLIWCGKRSYGVYLWHYPIMQSMHKFGVHWLVVLSLGTFLTVLVAALSYRYFETPMMQLRNGFPQRKPAASH